MSSGAEIRMPLADSDPSQVGQGQAGSFEGQVASTAELSVITVLCLVIDLNQELGIMHYQQFRCRRALRR